MEKNTVTKRINIPACDKYALEKYLSDMSAKGYIFTGFDKDSICNSKYNIKYLTFEKGNKERLYYCVDYFDVNDEKNDINHSESERISSIESKGWKLISKHSFIYIYCSNNVDLPSIGINYTSQRKILKKLNPYSFLFVLSRFTYILSLFYIFCVKDWINSPLNFYTQKYAYIFVPLLILLTIPLIFSLFYNYIKCKKTMIKYKKNKQPNNINYRSYTFHFYSYSICIAAAFFFGTLLFIINMNNEYEYTNIPDSYNIVRINKLTDTETVKDKYLIDDVDAFTHIEKYEQTNYVDNKAKCSIYECKYKFAYEWIAKDIYDRESSTYRYIRWKYFTQEECNYMNITEGKYGETYKQETVFIIRKNNIYSIIETENIKGIDNIKNSIKEVYGNT